jgi:single-stranded DNA-binding protein
LRLTELLAAECQDRPADGIGKVVASIRLATSRVVNGQEETQYHNVSCWDSLAETTARGTAQQRRRHPVAGRNSSPAASRPAAVVFRPRGTNV